MSISFHLFKEYILFGNLDTIQALRIYLTAIAFQLSFISNFDSCGIEKTFSSLTISDAFYVKHSLIFSSLQDFEKQLIE